MEENIRTQEEISLGDIFRILLRKIKVLVLALVIGAVVGAGFGVVRTYNVKYYGTTMQFYVNPKKDSASVTSAVNTGYTARTAPSLWTPSPSFWVRRVSPKN